MPRMAPFFSILASWALLASPLAAQAQRTMERLGRGVVAVPRPDGSVYLGWRLLGTDPAGIAFHVDRASEGWDPVRLTREPLRNSTNLVDPDPHPGLATTYTIRPVVGGRELEPGTSFRLAANPPRRQYLKIPIQGPPGYAPNDASAADLDGDGEYEVVLHLAGRGRDNSQEGPTDPPILQAFKLDGTRLWSIHLGRNIREGAHYTQFMAFDLDGDGRAEVACKTADGTVDGLGKAIGDASADHVNPAGRILSGPEFFTVFDGRTGGALATVD